MSSKHLLALLLASGLAATAAPAVAGDGDHDRYYREERTEYYDDDRYQDRYDDDDDYERRSYYREEHRYVPVQRRTIVHRVVPYVTRTEIVHDGPCRVERTFLSTGRIEESRRCAAPPPAVVVRPPVVEYRY